MEIRDIECLRKNYEKNAIFIGHNEKAIKQFIRLNCHNLELIIEFKDEDLEKIETLVNSVEDNFKYLIWDEYLSILILKQLDSNLINDKMDLEQSLENLLSEDYEKYSNIKGYRPNVSFTFDALEKIKGKIRIHIFMDNVKSIYFQKIINTYFDNKSNIVFFGYNDDLLIIDETVDYKALYPGSDYEMHVSNEFKPKEEDKNSKKTL